MIFEKMDALLHPNDKRELKWGIDIKLLKAYLSIKNGLTAQEVEDHLDKRWDDYTNDVRYGIVLELSEQLKEGRTVTEVLQTFLTDRTGEETIDLNQKLLGLFGHDHQPEIDELINAETTEEFEKRLGALLDEKQGPRLSYREASEESNNEYAKLLSQPLVQ